MPIRIVISIILFAAIFSTSTPLFLPLSLSEQSDPVEPLAQPPEQPVPGVHTPQRQRVQSVKHVSFSDDKLRILQGHKRPHLDERRGLAGERDASI